MEETETDLFVIQISGDPGIDMWWSNWLVVEACGTDQEEINKITSNIECDEGETVESETTKVYAALQASGIDVFSVRPARAVFIA